MKEFKNLRLRCIKSEKIDEVTPRNLREIGFPLDTDYKSPDYFSENIPYYAKFRQDVSPYTTDISLEFIYVEKLIELKDKEKAFEETLNYPKTFSISVGELKSLLISAHVFFLTREEAEMMLDEFIFIIETLLPRKVSDLYYSFDIMPNSAHWLFFKLAVKHLGLNYTEFTSHPKDLTEHTVEGVKKLILKGKTLNEIYLTTCATKNLILSAFKEIDFTITEMTTEIKNKWEIECSLFRLARTYNYKRDFLLNGKKFDFVVFEQENPVLAIDYVDMNSNENDLNIYKEYKSLLIEIYKTEIICKESKTPYLAIDNFYFEDEGSVSDLARNAIYYPDFTNEFYDDRRYYFYFLAKDAAVRYGKVFLDSAEYCVCLNCGKIFTGKPEDFNFSENSIVCPFCHEKAVITNTQLRQIAEKPAAFSSSPANLNKFIPPS